MLNPIYTFFINNLVIINYYNILNIQQIELLILINKIILSN